MVTIPLVAFPLLLSSGWDVDHQPYRYIPGSCTGSKFNGTTTLIYSVLSDYGVCGSDLKVTSSGVCNPCTSESVFDSVTNDGGLCDPSTLKITLCFGLISTFSSSSSSSSSTFSFLVLFSFLKMSRIMLTSHSSGHHMNVVSNISSSMND
jgi:hypothetical protein